MTQQIRIWEISHEDTLVEVESAKINLESRLENWLKNDISVLDPNLLVIGQQVTTDFGGKIDLLCLNNAGDTVVVELKRQKTARDVTAQVLDYASWVKDLKFEKIKEIASCHRLIEGPLDEAFQKNFDQPLPDEINLNQRSLIVAGSMDDSTERIVRYLSDLGVLINVTTVQHFQDKDGREMLAQVYLIEPEEVVVKPPPPRGLPNAREMASIAYKKGESIGELYTKLSNSFSGILNTASFGKESRGFRVKVEGNKWQAVFVVELGESSGKNGLVFRLNGTRLMRIFGVNEQELNAMLPKKETMSHSEWRGALPEEIANWKGYRCYFLTDQEIDKFIAGLRDAQAPDQGD